MSTHTPPADSTPAHSLQAARTARLVASKELADQLPTILDACAELSTSKAEAATALADAVVAIVTLTQCPADQTTSFAYEAIDHVRKAMNLLLEQADPLDRLIEAAGVLVALIPPATADTHSRKV